MFTVTTKGLNKIIRKLAGARSAFRSVKVWETIGHQIRANILLRTARGVDADKSPFDGYSAGYKAYRRENGRPTGKVNLFWSGTMLNSMDVVGTKHGVRLFFRPTQAPDYPGKKTSPKSPAKAYYLQHHKTKPRKFFAMSKSDIKEARQLLLNVVREALEQ